MRKFSILMASLAVLMCFSCSDLRAEELAPSGAGAEGLSAEGLLFLEVPVVVTASRKEQPVTEAPAAVTVISAEEIRLSGARTIPDLLQFVSGVDVMTISARDQQVGIRGLNRPLNNKVLVLIDGRSVYSDILGNVYWSLFPVPMAEIARIEVIKSPISSLYGANAYSGVINVITKSPGELGGSQVDLAAGSRDTSAGSVLYGGETGNFSYKFSAGFDRTDKWDSDQRAGDIARGNFFIGYDIDPEQNLSLSGGRVHFNDFEFFTHEVLGTVRQKGDLDYLQGDFRRGGFKLRMFRKTEDQDQRLLRTGKPNDWWVKTFDTEAQYAFDLGKSHALVAGLAYRHVTIDENDFIDDSHSQDLYALFFEDEIRLGKKWRLTAGGRYDHHPLVKGHFSPRATLLYQPTENQAIRLSASRAYRNPSFIESYLETSAPSGPLTVVSLGNRDLEPEGITSFEVGYRIAPLDRTTLEVNLFYNEYSDQFVWKTVVAPPQVITTFDNGMDSRGVGGEIDLQVRMTRWLTLFGNYSYQRITDRDDNPGTLTINENDRVRKETPRHKLNTGARMRLENGLSASLLLHWEDGTERLLTDLAGNEYLVRTDPFNIVNARIGYSFWRDRAEISLYAYNLFKNRHFEYPPGAGLPEESSAPVGRKVLFNLNCRF